MSLPMLTYAGCRKLRRARITEQVFCIFNHRTLSTTGDITGFPTSITFARIVLSDFVQHYGMALTGSSDHLTGTHTCSLGTSRHRRYRVGQRYSPCLPAHVVTE